MNKIKINVGKFSMKLMYWDKDQPISVKWLKKNVKILVILVGNGKTSTLVAKGYRLKQVWELRNILN